jgi:hypothetical protein
MGEDFEAFLIFVGGNILLYLLSRLDGCVGNIARFLIIVWDFIAALIVLVIFLEFFGIIQG